MREEMFRVGYYPQEYLERMIWINT